jgi:hypothetical protein
VLLEGAFGTEERFRLIKLMILLGQRALEIAED